MALKAATEAISGFGRAGLDGKADERQGDVGPRSRMYDPLRDQIVDALRRQDGDVGGFPGSQALKQGDGGGEIGLDRAFPSLVPRPLLASRP